MKFAFTIVTLATNSGVHCSGVHFHLLLEWLPGAFSRSFVMPANAVGRGSFGIPVGGGRRWVEFRIVFESAGLFHGEVINAGFVCHKLNPLSRCHVRHGGFVPWRIERSETSLV